jgi:hypothetical protein
MDARQIEFVEPQTDRALDWALAYAAAGMRVFPCNNKQPLLEHGHLEATTEAATLARWWARWPHADIGWALPEGVVVVDIDLDPPRKYGFDDYAVLDGRNADDVETPQARTPRGGRHLIHATTLPPDEIATVLRPLRVRGQICGVETRRPTRNYIVLPRPGSGRAWVKPLSILLAPAPAWLQWPLAAEPSADVDRPISGPDLDARLRGIAQRVASAIEGERNSITFWASCRVAELVAAGVIDREWVSKLIALAADRAGLPHIEAQRTIASAFRGASHG